MQQIAKDRRSRLADLNNLEQSLQELVTPEVADDYQSAQDFSEQCEELRTGWNELDDAVHNLIIESDAKVTYYVYWKLLHSIAIHYRQPNGRRGQPMP